MPKNPELDARCAYALYKIIGAANAAHRQVGLDGAEACGFAAYPGKHVSTFFVDEPELSAAHRAGWARAEEANRPRTADELKAVLDKMDKESYSGCGQFYELYAQRFTSTVDSWIPSLRAGELETVLGLLKGMCYEPDPGGYWVYDQEEGDIHFVETSDDR
jgi:hypothetical protein